jgi:hypothetical protein
MLEADHQAPGIPCALFSGCRFLHKNPGQIPAAGRAELCMYWNVVTRRSY